MLPVPVLEVTAPRGAQANTVSVCRFDAHPDFAALALKTGHRSVWRRLHRQSKHLLPVHLERLETHP